LIGVVLGPAVAGPLEEGEDERPALVERGEHLLGRRRLLADGQAVADDDL
jgi:hypothetical protein